MPHAPPRPGPRAPSSLPPPTPLQPCHPPLALAPRRLYTSPMRNPTSACPHLPDAARGTSQRSRNCPQSGPPYPQNGSCWTKRIVSATDGFEADSFPKKEKLEQNLEFNQIAGAPLVLRGHPRAGRPLHNHVIPALPSRHSRAGGNPGWRRGAGHPPITAPAPNPIKSPTPRRSYRRGPKSKQSPFFHFPASESAKKPSTILRS